MIRLKNGYVFVPTLVDITKIILQCIEYICTVHVNMNILIFIHNQCVNIILVETTNGWE